MTKPTPYDAARDALATLEREYATIDEQIKRAGLSGDFAAVNLCLARKPILPILVEQAKRTLAPLEVVWIDSEIERVRAEVAPVYATIEALQAKVQEAQRELAIANMGTIDAQETLSQLAGERTHAWRRAKAYAEHPEGLPEKQQGRVVRSTWQAGNR